MEAFGIFEGGGAKGLAHVGAIKAAEERKIQFIGVAGASAGAIAAALVAAGYEADDLYTPGAAQGKLNIDFISLLEKLLWQQFVNLKGDTKNTFVGVSPTKAWFRAGGFYRRNKEILSTLSRRRGIFDSAKFEALLNQVLQDKIGTGSGPSGEILFGDLPLPLKIIASDVTKQRIKIFSKDLTPTIPISTAVAASIAIPYFFVPKRIEENPDTTEETELVDGGLLSNFPAWLFDDERRRNGPHVPTFGFRLFQRDQEDGQKDSFLNFSKRLFSTVLSGDQQLEVREIENLNIIPLPVSVGTFDFDLSAVQKDRLYSDGKSAAQQFFLNELGPRDPQFMRRALEQVGTSFQQEALSNKNGHLRVNVVMKTTKGTLRVLYNWAMDNDADDRLEFEIGSGASGSCWEQQRPVVCDLNAAKATFASQWKMNKYQQALVRRELNSLLCVPIFDPSTAQIIAVLNFDSDDNLLAEFMTPLALKAGKKAAEFIATILCRAY